jgi:Phosphoenolpyruvate carboxylase
MTGHVALLGWGSGRIGVHCRAFEETKRELLAVESHKALLSDPHTAMLQAKLKLRTPYITPLNILQVQSPPFCRPAVHFLTVIHATAQQPRIPFCRLYYFFRGTVLARLLPWYHNGGP